jgi:ubiquinone/menaquinone biosynthesis C-methylase UbiE
MSPTTTAHEAKQHQSGRSSVRPDGRADVIDDFDAINRRYDLLTRMNPGYTTHLAWSAQRLHLGPQARILDLCCGTGLSTRALLDTYPDAALIVGLDASAGMLAQADKRLTTNGPRPRIELVVGDATDPAQALPEGSRGPFDGILMAYGIRNVPDPDRCLANLLELLAPGAPICFHEYSVADSPIAKAVWNAVALSVITPLGVALSGNMRMWSYLRRSVNRFDGVHTFERRLARHGFSDVRTEPMNGWQRGIVHSFLARRPYR